MKSELRVGRLRGTGATITLSTANQVVGGLSCTLDIPKGNVALVTLCAQALLQSQTAYAYLEVDGTLMQPPIVVSGGTVAVYATGAESFAVTPGRRALRVLVSVNIAPGTIDPAGCTLSWIIAPQGGIAN